MNYYKTDQLTRKQISVHLIPMKHCAEYSR